MGKRGWKTRHGWEMLTGAESAVRVRAWLEEDYPADAELIMGDLPWRESPEPLGTPRALRRWYVRERESLRERAKLGERYRRMERQE